MQIYPDKMKNVISASFICISLMEWSVERAVVYIASLKYWDWNDCDKNSNQIKILKDPWLWKTLWLCCINRIESTISLKHPSTIKHSGLQKNSVLHHALSVMCSVLPFIWIKLIFIFQKHFIQAAWSFNVPVKIFWQKAYIWSVKSMKFHWLTSILSSVSHALNLPITTLDFWFHPKSKCKRIILTILKMLGRNELTGLERQFMVKCSQHAFALVYVILPFVTNLLVKLIKASFILIYEMVKGASFSLVLLLHLKNQLFIQTLAVIFWMYEGTDIKLSRGRSVRTACISLSLAVRDSEITATQS